jgi:hypothetical protein
MKSARIAGLSIDELSNIRYYVEDHRKGVFELGAPTTDVLDVTGRPAEDFETIARRYAAQSRNQRTFSNWVREFTLFMMAPFAPGVNPERYDRELRRPFPSAPRFAVDSAIWRDEHDLGHTIQPATPVRTGVRSSVAPAPQSTVIPGESR